MWGKGEDVKDLNNCVFREGFFILENRRVSGQPDTLVDKQRKIFYIMIFVLLQPRLPSLFNGCAFPLTLMSESPCEFFPFDG